MSCADGSTCPSGGRRTTTRPPAPSTRYVRLDLPPLMRVPVSGGVSAPPVASATYGAIRSRSSPGGAIGLLPHTDRSVCRTVRRGRSGCQRRLRPFRLGASDAALRPGMVVGYPYPVAAGVLGRVQRRVGGGRQFRGRGGVLGRGRDAEAHRDG